MSKRTLTVCCGWLAIALPLAASLLCATTASSGTVTIALTAQNAPEGNGALSSFAAPAVNNAGKVTLSAQLTGTLSAADAAGIYQFNGASLVNLLRADTNVPEGDGKFGLGVSPLGSYPLAVNGSGQVAFSSDLTSTSGGTADNSGVDFYNGSAVVNYARKNAAVPEGNGNFDVFSPIALNNSGKVAFTAALKSTSGGSTDNSGVYLYNGAAIVNLARAKTAVPEGNGNYKSFSNSLYAPALNGPGQVAFSATLQDTAGGTADNSGVYLYNGAAVVNRAREDGAVPEGNGGFDSFFAPALNGTGQVAFWAGLKSTSGGTADDSGIYLHNGSALVNIARENGNVPEGNGQFSDFFDSATNRSPAINNNGQIAFMAQLKGTSGTTTDDSGVYMYNGSVLVNMARENANTPDGNGKFSAFSNPAIDGGGQVMFSTTLRNTSNPGSDDSGIYLAGNQQRLKVVRTGDTLAGKTVSALSVLTGNGPDAQTGRATGFNDYAQVAYRAAFTDGTSGVFLFTPEIHWGNIPGGWSTAANWTLGIQPGLPHDVFIDPAIGLTVYGPTNTVSIHSLSIGTLAGPTIFLNLQSGGNLNAAAGITVQPSGVMSGSSTINADLTNLGIIQANTLTVNGSLTNSGSLSVINSSMMSVGESVDGVGDTTVQTGSQLVANSYRQNSLIINANAQVIARPSAGGTAAGDHTTTSGPGSVNVLGSLNLTDPTAKLDLANNDLIVKGIGLAGLDTVRDWLRSAYLDGGLKDWKGPGVGSIQAASQGMALGSILNGTPVLYSSYAGISGLNNTDVIVKYTFPGDTNLDGQVNTADALALATAFGATSGKRWVNGDVNYDGAVNTEDALSLATAFGAGVGSPVSAALVSNKTVPVPEPASAVLFILGAMGICKARRFGQRHRGLIKRR